MNLNAGSVPGAVGEAPKTQPASPCCQRTGGIIGSFDGNENPPCEIRFALIVDELDAVFPDDLLNSAHTAIALFRGGFDAPSLQENMDDPFL